jgi:hypothetical protein
MTDTPHPLRPASAEEIEQALAHALRFDGRKAFKLSSESMAKITAAHLAECLRQSGFVVMKKPPEPPHRAPAYGRGYGMDDPAADAPSEAPAGQNCA